MSSMAGETKSTIEFELSADELLGLSRVQTPEREQTPPSRSVDGWCVRDGSFPQASAVLQACAFALNAARVLRLRSWGIGGIALVASVALALLLLGIARQQISTPVEQPQSAATSLAANTEEAVETPSTSASKPLPVRFANPFDPTEVFEFPPGTSPEYARKAVAEFLINRARDRHPRHERRSRT